MFCEVTRLYKRGNDVFAQIEVKTANGDTFKKKKVKLADEQDATVQAAVDAMLAEVNVADAPVELPLPANKFRKNKGGGPV